MSTPLSLYDLVEAFAQPGCPVCQLLQRDVRRFLGNLLYEGVSDPEAHASLQDSYGLCNVHAWQLRQVHEGQLLSIALFYRSAVTAALGRLEAGGSPRAEALRPTAACPACKALVDAEERYVGILAAHSTDDQLVQVYRNSDGLCLPHFRQVLNRLGRPDSARHLIALQRAIWERLLTDLQTFIEMHDYRHTGERMAGERDSWLRAIRSLAGEEGIWGLDR